jgi:hypothetical protein
MPETPPPPGGRPSALHGTDDPLADQVGRWPIKRGGAHVRFAGQRLVSPGPGHVQFRGTWPARLFFLPPALPGFAIWGLLVWRGDRLEVHEIGLIFVMGALLVAWAALYRLAAPCVRFDKESGMVTRVTLPLFAPARRVPLSDVHALQLLRAPAGSGFRSFPCYELNLVLHDGRRVNVAGHGHLDRLRRDARVLRSFLQVPLWDVAEVDAPRPPRRRGWMRDA